MAIVITNDQNYKDIASAIRDKGVDGSFTPAQMSAAVRSIPQGGDPTPVVNYGKMVVFGDSLTAGYRNLNNYSWTNYVMNSGKFESISNHAVSGSTIGAYSADTSVRNQCLLMQIPNHRSEIEEADVVVLAYGGNDSRAVSEKICAYNRVLGDLESALGLIYDLNPEVRLVFMPTTEVLIEPKVSEVSPYQLSYIVRTMHYLLNAFCTHYHIQFFSLVQASGIGYNGVERGLVWDETNDVHPKIPGCDLLGQEFIRLFESGYYEPRITSFRYFFHVRNAGTTSAPRLVMDFGDAISLGMMFELGLWPSVIITIDGYPSLYFLNCTEVGLNSVVFTLHNRTSMDNLMGIRVKSDNSLELYV